MRLLFIIGFALMVFAAAVTLLAPWFLPPPLMEKLSEQVVGRQIALPSPVVPMIPSNAIPPTTTPLPAPTATTEVRCGPPTGWGVYSIQVGDTLSDLAARTGVSVEQIQFANCLDGDLIFADTPLFLPRAPDPRPVQLPTDTPIAAPAPSTPRPTFVPIILTPVALTGTPLQISPAPVTPIPTAPPDPSFTPAPGITFIPATDTPAQSENSPTATLASATSTRSPTEVATIVPTPLTIPTAVVAAEYPVQLDIEDSAVLVVVLIQDGKAAPTASLPNQTVVVVPVPPVGTPGPALKDQFGIDFGATVRAELVAPGFEPVAAGAVQTLDQASISWSWGLKPKGKGQQTIRISIQGEWQPNNGGPAITHEIWSRQLSVQVTERLFTRGQISVSGVVCSLVGSSFSIPWFIAQLRQLWRQRRGAARRTPGRRR